MGGRRSEGGTGEVNLWRVTPSCRSCRFVASTSGTCKAADSTVRVSLPSTAPSPPPPIHPCSHAWAPLPSCPNQQLERALPPPLAPPDAPTSLLTTARRQRAHAMARRPCCPCSRLTSYPAPQQLAHTPLACSNTATMGFMHQHHVHSYPASHQLTHTPPANPHPARLQQHRHNGLHAPAPYTLLPRVPPANPHPTS